MVKVWRIGIMAARFSFREDVNTIFGLVFEALCFGDFSQMVCKNMFSSIRKRDLLRCDFAFHFVRVLSWCDRVIVTFAFHCGLGLFL